MLIDLFNQYHCTPGHEDRCRGAKEKDCACSCGGHNHGQNPMLKKIDQPKVKFISEEDFYKKKSRRLSPELDFGVWWKDGKTYPTFRISWVENTGELYAFSVANPRLEIIGKIKGRENIERVLKGWAEKCGQINSLEWVRRRLAK